jgi:cyanophycinase-like exopeptidase
MRLLLLVLLSIFSLHGFTQDYDIWRTGSSSDSETESFLPGILLAGGGIDQDQAMTWFLNRAGGGDVVIIRTSGSDGYNNYLFSSLGVTVNSVTTIRLNNANASTNAEVLETVVNAEALFFAGGNQYNYYSFFQNTPLMDTINYLANEKQIVIGGTSAGMAILGQGYYAALPGTAPGTTSAQALSNPFHASMVNLGHGDFLQIPFLENTVTDTHYEDRNRRGRHSVFIGRLAQETEEQYFGIAANDHCAITVDENGLASAYGEFPTYQEDQVFFIQSSCQDDWLPETMQANTPVTWNRNQKALKVYRVPATISGANNFSLDDWESGSGGFWERWWINNGNFTWASSSIAGCEPETVSIWVEPSGDTPEILCYPNPFTNSFTIKQKELTSEPLTIEIFNAQGKRIINELITTEESLIEMQSVPAGIYIIRFFNLRGEPKGARKLLKQ